MSVYVVQEPRSVKHKPYDITPALQFGQPVYVFAATFSPAQMPGRAITEMKRKLAEFQPDKDYLLWAGGDPFGLALVSGYVIDKWGEVQWLRYERDLRTGGGFYAPTSLKVR